MFRERSAETPSEPSRLWADGGRSVLAAWLASSGRKESHDLVLERLGVSMKLDRILAAKVRIINQPRDMRIPVQVVVIASDDEGQVMARQLGASSPIPVLERVVGRKCGGALVSTPQSEAHGVGCRQQ